MDHADMQQALSLFLDQAGKGGNGQGQGTQQGSVLIPSQLQQRTGNRKTMTGSHPQLHNPHPAEPSSPSQGRNPVCGRNLLVAPDIALLGRGPPPLPNPGSEKQERSQSRGSHTEVFRVWKAVQPLPLPTQTQALTRHIMEMSTNTEETHYTKTWKYRHRETDMETHPDMHTDTPIFTQKHTHTYTWRHTQTQACILTYRHRHIHGETPTDTQHTGHRQAQKQMAQTQTHRHAHVTND